MSAQKVALIGAGQISRTSHIPSFLKMDNVDIVGICDTNMASAISCAKQFGIEHYYNDHIEMLSALHPDVVCVCVPNRFHCQITIDALNSGAHVICEKPPAITGEEARKMEEAAVKNNRFLTYGFHFRYAKKVAYLKKKIEAGEFGQIYKVNASWLRRRGIPGWGCFTNKDIQGGGPLIDIGAHMLDLAVYLMGYPEVSYVCAKQHDLIGRKGGIGLMGSWDKEKFSVEDELTGLIVFKNGASLVLETSFALNMRDKDVRSVRLYGDKMGVELFPLEIYGEEDGSLYNKTFPFDDLGDLHEIELNEIMTSFAAGKAPLVEAWQGTYVEKLIDALYYSAQSGKPIEL